MSARATVLIADDDESIRQMVARVLRRSGFETAEASDGQDALERLESGSFDALVLDLMMPRLDGFGVVSHLLLTRPRMVTKTVVMTAFPKSAAQERLHHLCAVLSKPFDVRDLVSAVELCARR